MASNSDMFDYLLPTKRRKYSFSSDITQKCGDDIDNVLYPSDFDAKILNQNDKKTESELRETEYYEYEEYQAKHKIPENRKEQQQQQEKCRVPTSASTQQQSLTDNNSIINHTAADQAATIGPSQSEMSVIFEDCVNELMNKNGFLLPVNHNHRHEDYFDEDDDDDDDDDDEDDDDYDDDCDDDEGFERPDHLGNNVQQHQSHTSEILRTKARNIRWVRKQILAGVHPLEIRSLRLPHISDMLLWSIITRALSDPPRRMPLMHIKTIDDVVNLLRTSKNIIVLTGAGVSVSCGIPDFRSRDGIYSRLAIDYPDLPDPQAMFSISYFNQDPRPFFKFAREIYPGQFKPSPCHRFIKLLEKKNKLLRNYTQNIDTLEQIAGINNVIECHGSFATATCTRCRTKVSANRIREEIFAQKIPLCQLCNPGQESPSSSDLNTDDSYRTIVWRGIMKPDIVFFGEDLPEQFHLAIDSDRKKCDLLIVIGSSLKVRPVALIPNSIPNRVPQILINRETLSHLDFDIELLGNSDTIINQLCYMVGEDWTDICCGPELELFEKLRKPAKTTPRPGSSPNSSADSSDGDYRSVMQMSIDSGFDSSSNPSTSSVSMSSSSPISDSEYQATLSSDDSSSIDQIHDHEVVSIPPPPPQVVNCATTSAAIVSADITKPSTTTVERHMSIDSTKDSGICGSSSSTSFVEDESSSSSGREMHDVAKKSIAEFLPTNTYCRYRQHSYIFPGAEIYWDSDDDNDDDDDDDDDEEDDTNEDDVDLVADDICGNSKYTNVVGVNKINDGGGGGVGNDDNDDTAEMDGTKLNFNSH